MTSLAPCFGRDNTRKLGGAYQGVSQHGQIRIPSPSPACLESPVDVPKVMILNIQVMIPQ
jgi:hypothetical protein